MCIRDSFREFLVDQTPHNVVVTGLRGVGKTVLLQRYRSEALEAGWLVADREFSEADAEPSMFAQRLLSDLTRLTRDLSLSRRLRDLASGAAERVTDFLGSLSVSYEGIELGYSPGRRRCRGLLPMRRAEIGAAPLPRGTEFGSHSKHGSISYLASTLSTRVR